MSQTTDDTLSAHAKRSSAYRGLFCAGAGLLVLLLAASVTLLEARICEALDLSQPCKVVPDWFYNAAFAVFYAGFGVSVISLIIDVWRARRSRK